MKALNVFLFSNTKEHMLLTVRIECSFEIQSITRKYGHGYGNEQKKQSFSCHLLLSTVCRSFAGVTRSMMDTDNSTPSPKRRLNFILSQNNECSHLLRTHVKWFWILFHELHLFFFPIQLHIPRGYSKKFRGRVPPEVLHLIRLYTIFDVISSMRRSVSSPDEERREEKREEELKIRRAAEYFIFIEKHYPFHIPKMTDFPTLSYTSTGEIPFLSFT